MAVGKSQGNIIKHHHCCRAFSSRTSHPFLFLRLNGFRFRKIRMVFGRCLVAPYRLYVLYFFHFSVLAALRPHLTSAHPFGFVLILNEMQNNASRRIEFSPAFPGLVAFAICLCGCYVLCPYKCVRAHSLILFSIPFSFYLLAFDTEWIRWCWRKATGSIENNGRKRYGDFKLNDNSVHKCAFKRYEEKVPAAQD